MWEKGLRFQPVSSYCRKVPQINSTEPGQEAIILRLQIQTELHLPATLPSTLLSISPNGIVSRFEPATH